MSLAKLAMRLTDQQRRRIDEAEARRRAAETVVVSGVRLTPSQRRVLAEAETLAAGDWRDRQRAARLVRDVEQQLREAREEQAVTAGVAETIGLRGGYEVEKVEQAEWRRDDSGALVRSKGVPVLAVWAVKRARRISPVRGLHRSGVLSDSDMATVDAYLKLLEAARPAVGVSALEAGDKNVTGTDRLVFAQLDRARAGLALEALHSVIGPVAQRVVTAVVVEERGLRTLDGAGRAVDRNKAVLVGALKKMRVELLGGVV